jgi:hypothetical protein
VLRLYNIATVGGGDLVAGLIMLHCDLGQIPMVSNIHVYLPLFIDFNKFGSLVHYLLVCSIDRVQLSLIFN